MYGAAIRQGIVFALASTFFLALSHVIAKLLSEHYHPVVITFFRSFITLVLTVGWVVATRRIFLLKTERPWAQLSRGLIGNVGLFLVISSYAALSVSDISAVLNTSPLFAAALAFLFLGERADWKTTLALIIGFLGALIIIRPTGALSGGELLLALSASVAIALQTVLLRHLGRTDAAVTTVFYYALTGTVLMIPAMPFFWTGWSDSLLWLVLGMGFIGMAAQLTRTHSLRFLPVTLKEVIGYSFFLWSLMLGFLIWHDIPTWFVLAGTAIVIVCNVYIVRRAGKNDVS